MRKIAAKSSIRATAKPRLALCLQRGDGLPMGPGATEIQNIFEGDRPRLRRLVLAALALGAPEGEPAPTAIDMTLRLVDAAEGQALNREYRGKNKPTNILTFPYSTCPVLAADLVFCLPVLQAEAEAMGVALRSHLAHLVVHGSLHALGWEHDCEPEASTMESIEAEVLARFGIPNPYAAPQS